MGERENGGCGGLNRGTILLPVYRLGRFFMRGIARLLFTLSPVLLLALSQTGCLPSSQKQNTRALTPSDSLSRDLAATAPADTLQFVWQAEAPEATPFEFPTSIAWLPDSFGGRIVVADTRTGGLHTLSSEGGYVGVQQPEGLEFPYLAGQRADTLVVFSRGPNRLDFVVDGASERQVDLPEGGFSAALATDSALYVKRTDEEEVFLARLTEDGQLAERYELVGPDWRHIGFLRPYGDAVLSLSGYRPVVDIVRPTTPGGATLDTLALAGFDSPQFVRSFQFLTGEIDEPPLLTSSAVSIGDHLVVVNLRVEQIHLDVYGPDGNGGFRLERALIYPDMAAVADVFPADIAVHEDAEGWRIVLLMQRPGGVLSRSGGRVLMLRWKNGVAAS